VNAVKSVNKNTGQAGRPAGAAWEVELIDFSKRIIPLDFISTHYMELDKDSWMSWKFRTILDKNPMSVSGDVINSKKKLPTLRSRIWNCNIQNVVLLTHC
jgi:xylan 1,4-beta-xylosidase